jgi:hypothetical protein
MTQNRKAPRVYPKDFADYSVNFDMDGSLSKGFLGNISEGGLCAVMSPDFICEVDSPIKGFVMQEPMQEKFSFDGRIAWKLDCEINKAPRLMLGLEFSVPLELPEQLMVISLSVES